MTRLRFLYHIGLITILWLCLSLPQFRYLGELPRGVHVWAQSDRYALALNYLAYPKFSEPRTQALYTENGRVGVEFPLIPFLSAKLSSFTNTPHLLPFWFRLLTSLLLITCLYASAMVCGMKPIMASAAVFLVMASPVISFYGYNFLPDIGGLSFSVLALALYWRSTRQGKSSDSDLALVFSALAMLLKLSSGIYFMAMVAHQFFISLKLTRQLILRKVPFFLFALLLFSCIVWYNYFYFIRVNKLLWSGVFMSSGQPITSLPELAEVLKSMFYWRGEYLSNLQYLVLIISSIFYVHRIKGNRTLRYLIAIIFLGWVAFLLGLGQQLRYHDYYVLASFLPLLVFGLFHFVSDLAGRLPEQKFPALYLLCFLIWVCSIPQIAARNHHIYHRNKVHIDSDIRWLSGAKNCVQDYIPDKNATLFVLYEQAPNTSLIYLNHKGLVFNHEQMGRKEAHLEYWIDRIKPKYFILQSKYKADLQRDKPYLLEKHSILCNDVILIIN